LLTFFFGLPDQFVTLCFSFLLSFSLPVSIALPAASLTVSPVVAFNPELLSPVPLPNTGVTIGLPKTPVILTFIFRISAGLKAKPNAAA